MMGSSSRDKSAVEMQDYMINWNVGPLGLVLRPDLGADMPPVVSQVLPGESVASLAGVSVGDMLVGVNGKKASKLGYEKAMKLLYKQKLPILLHFRIPQFKTADASAYYHTPTNGSVSMTPSPARHGSNASQNPYQSSSFGAPSPYPGQFVQYSQQQQQFQQQYQHQPYQQHPPPPMYPDQQQQAHPSPHAPFQRAAAGSMVSNNRGARSHSVLSTATATKEQKLKKQFSVVWSSGSLGFSFRPYAPGVNIPTVDLIGARGEGKNMDQVCVNDVLIAINGENTKSMGVERVLKMLHVLEKPVVLRFHKSSHRIENPPPASLAATRTRRRSSVKLAAVAEKDGDGDDGDDKANGGIELMQQDDGLPSVRFADQIQLRSEQRDDETLPPPPPPPPPLLLAATPPSTPELTTKRRVLAGLEQAERMDPASTMPVPTADKSASRVAASAHSPLRREHQHQHHHHHHHHAQTHSVSSSRVQASVPPPAATAPTHFALPKQELDEFPEPDDTPNDVDDVDESTLTHVPITIVGSVPPKKPSSSFVIPLEHAREIVAKSSGKPVELCEFGGIPLPKIKEGSVQARLLVTFAKACLAKQMQQLREEGKEPLVKARAQTESRESPKAPTPPRSSSPHSSENRSSIANAGSTYVPSDASVFANSNGPTKAKFRAFSIPQQDSASTLLGQELLSSQVVAENEPLGNQRGTVVTNISSTGLSTDSADPMRSSEDSARRLSELPMELNHPRFTSQSVLSMQRSSEADRSSNGGLTMSQLRLSDKLSSNSSSFDGMLKDLNTPPENNGTLPQRVTEMISLDALHIEEEVKEEEPLVPEATATISPVKEGSDENITDFTVDTVRLSEDASPNVQPAASAVVESAREPVDVHRKLSVPAYVDHPVIQNLCIGSRDLELVMVGRDVDMILCKKDVVEEIQDILDSLEMELQFERHSHVGIGHGSIMDEPPLRCCSRCGKTGDLADLALDSERRELYCQNCWDVFFYKGSPRSSRGRLEPPEFDTPTDFDPFEYSLHDSMVNVADEFHPWRHLQFDDASSQRDSNLTQVSSITSHADEVWL